MSDKCLVFGCTNRKGEGRDFVWEFCRPCYEMITTGEVGPTNSFLNKLNTKELTLVEARVAQKAAEADVLAVISKFEKLTELHVESVEAFLRQVIGKYQPETFQIKFVTKL